MVTAIRAATRLTRPQPCIFCQHRSLHASRRLRQTPPPQAPQTPKQTVTPPANPNRPHVRARDGELVPKPLSRPLGLPVPPQSGQNSGRDDRSWSQRRDDFASYDKHLARRQGLIKDLYEKNYFRDIGNIGVIHKGKSILAPATPFRKDLAMYFPNLQGRTLEPESVGQSDTTRVLKGRVSVVSVLSSDWAKAQCQSFLSETANPALHEYLKQEGIMDVAQHVEINVEENMLKHGLVRMFMGSMRRQRKQEDWAKYFLVSRGLDDYLRDALAIWNSKVGHVYLLDGSCKIRWAGNGDAKDDEKQSLVRCLGRLVDEARGVQKLRRQEPKKATPSVPPATPVAA